MNRTCAIPAALLCAATLACEPPTSSEPGTVVELQLDGPGSGPIAVSADGRRVYLALADHGDVCAVDAASLARERCTSVAGRPHRVAVHDDGRVGVSTRSGNLVVLQRDLGFVRRVAVGADPGGVIATPDGFAVALRADRQVAFVDDDSVERVTLSLEMPDGLALYDDNTLVVTSGGADSVVALVSTERPRRQREVRALSDRDGLNLPHVSMAARAATVLPRPDDDPVVLVPHVAVDREPGGSSPPRQAANYYAPPSSAAPGAVVPAVAALDTPDGNLRIPVLEPLSSHPAAVVSARLSTTSDGVRRDTALFWSFDQSGGVALVNTFPFSRTSLVRTDDPGLAGAAVAPDGGAVFSWNELTSTVRRYDVAVFTNPDGSWGSLEDAGAVELGNALPLAVRRGKRLFLEASTRTAGNEMLACASCHPDGGALGVAFRFSVGPRQPQPLWGGAVSASPLHWDGAVTAFSDLNDVTIRDRMNGEGLAPSQLEDLLAYLVQLPPPPPPSLDALAVARGQEIFFRDETGCSTCHVPPLYTDRLPHDVGASLGNQIGDELVEAITPSLLGLGRSAPYLHDGRASRVLDVLETLVVTDRMGTGSQLSDDELRDLAAFLRSL